MNIGTYGKGRHWPTALGLIILSPSTAMPLSTRTANGTETLIYGRGGEAEKLAAKVQAKVVTALGTRDRGIKVRPELHVLARTKMPAILVELAFISNPQEEKLLADPDRQREAARAIAQGIADYLGVRLRDNPIKEG